MKLDKETAIKNEKRIKEISKEKGNLFCCDCEEKGVRWASANIGCFLCINCAGMHRKLGTHISKIKSLTLDCWSDKEVEVMERNGNERVNSYYNPNKKFHPFPEKNSEIEKFIRSKYETKLFSQDKKDNQNIEQLSDVFCNKKKEQTNDQILVDVFEDNEKKTVLEDVWEKKDPLPREEINSDLNVSLLEEDENPWM